jgi:large subunit ribosomal protein L13
MGSDPKRIGEKMKTYYPKQSDIKKEWRLIDLKGKTVGRIATEIAGILVGKDKPTYEPSVDTGDFVVAINSDGIKFTGNKLTDKVYYRHTGAIGGIKEMTAKDLMKKDSTQVIVHAVRGMLPKNKLGRNAIKKLKVYKNDQHRHEAQKPQAAV